MNLFEAKQILKNAGYLVEGNMTLKNKISNAKRFNSKNEVYIYESDDNSIWDRFAWYDGVIGDYDEFLADKFDEEPDLENEADDFEDKIIKEAKKFGKVYVDGHAGTSCEISDNFAIHFTAVYDKQNENWLVMGIIDGFNEDDMPYSEYSPRVISDISNMKNIIERLKTAFKNI